MLTQAEFHELSALLQRGLDLHRANRLQEAHQCYQRILEIDPKQFDALQLSATLQRQIGNHAAALHLFDQALQIDQGNPAVFNNRGNALKDLGRFDEALSSYTEAIRLKPDYAEAYNNRGLVLRELRRFDEALSSYTEAIRIRQDYADAFYNRGVMLQERKQFGDALSNYAEVIRIKPEYAEAYNNRAVVLQELKRFDEALSNYAIAVHLKPGYADAFFNRGNTLKALARFDEAVLSYAEAIRIQPDYPDAFINKGLALRELKRFDEALSNYAEALQLQPDYDEVYWNQSLILLLLGRLAEGWPLYEWRLRKHETKDQYLTGPHIAWRGRESISGKRLLIQCEQGLGDSIQFCRYLRMVLGLGAEVILQVQKPLLSLFSAIPLPLTLVGKGDPLPEFDAHCPLMSLPLAFHTTLETIPASSPYLVADADKALAWKQKLGKKDRPRVGLVWTGSPAHKNDSNRSIQLEQFLPMLDLPVEWHSLQKDYRDADKHVLDGQSRIQDHQLELEDFSDTAALMDSMDLIISVDTSVAHLAGAMNKEVWILLPHVPDFRWLMDREDSPWYPTARLFRQDERRDWRSVVDRVRIELLKKITPQ